VLATLHSCQAVLSTHSHDRDPLVGWGEALGVGGAEARKESVSEARTKDVNHTRPPH
jgi:hypothetical protein